MNIIDETFPEDSLIDHINLEYKEYVPVQRAINTDNPTCAIENQTKVANNKNTTSTAIESSSQQQRFTKAKAATLRSNTFRRHQPLNKKSRSVDSLHSSSSAEMAGKPSPSYQHVESKVKIYIDQLQEQDRLNVKFKRHRSMPEKLSRSPVQELECVAGSSSCSSSGGSSSGNNNSDLVAIQLELEEKIKLLDHNDEVIANLKIFYESADRNYTEECQKNLKLQNKIDAMRLELLRISEEHQLYKMQQQQHQQPSYKLFDKFQKSNSQVHDKQQDTSEIMFSNSSIGSSVGSILSAVLTTKNNDALSENSFLLRKRTKSGGCHGVTGKYTRHMDSDSSDDEELLGRLRHKPNNIAPAISPPPITSTASKAASAAVDRLGAPKKCKKFKKRKRSRILKLFSYCSWCVGGVHGNPNFQMDHFDKVAFSRDSAYNSNLNSFT